MDINMPWVHLADGTIVQVPAGQNGAPDMSAVGPLAQTQQMPDMRTISRGDFVARLTLPELAALAAAQQGSPAIAALVLRVQTADVIRLDHPDTVAGLDALVAAGVLASGRPAEIRA